MTCCATRMRLKGLQQHRRKGWREGQGEGRGRGQGQEQAEALGLRGYSWLGWLEGRQVAPAACHSHTHGQQAGRLLGTWRPASRACVLGPCLSMGMASHVPPLPEQRTFASNTHNPAHHLLHCSPSSACLTASLSAAPPLPASQLPLCSSASVWPAASPLQPPLCLHRSFPSAAPLLLFLAQLHGTLAHRKKASIQTPGSSARRYGPSRRVSSCG